MGVIAATIISAVITLLGGAALMVSSPVASDGETKSRYGADVGSLSSPLQLASGPLA